VGVVDGCCTGELRRGGIDSELRRQGRERGESERESSGRERERAQRSIYRGWEEEERRPRRERGGRGLQAAINSVHQRREVVTHVFEAPITPQTNGRLRGCSGAVCAAGCSLASGFGARGRVLGSCFWARGFGRTSWCGLLGGVGAVGRRSGRLATRASLGARGRGAGAARASRLLAGFCSADRGRGGEAGVRGLFGSLVAAGKSKEKEEREGHGRGEPGGGWGRRLGAARLALVGSNGLLGFS
jgi:hypothetical protein